MTSEAAPEGRTLLIVEDDLTFRTRLTRAFHDRGLEVSAAGTYEEAMALAESDTPELALVDLRLPTRSGLDVVRGLKALDATTLIVVLTGYGSIATAVESIKAGARSYLTKPVDADQILAAFAEAPAPHGGEPAYRISSLARVEWEYIQRVLTECNGNLSQAARLLGIHRRSLQRKLSKDPSPETPHT
ncbi:MAG TPA: response regulator [Burkholderiaceae bacterium]|nr:response regulator [Burkholderiaceae bacterium]